MSAPTRHADATLRFRLVTGELPEALGSLARLPTGSFFQSPAWMRAVAVAEPRLRPTVLLAEGSAGEKTEIQGAVPFFRVSKLGVRRLYAGAWGTYGGVLAAENSTARALAAQLEVLAAGPRTALVRAHDFAGTLAGGAWTEIEEICQVLELPQDAQTLFRDAFTMQNRNKIRKAEKSGLRVRQASDAAALASYADIYAESAARWKLEQPLPARFFAALAGAPGTQVWLAEQEGKPIAALLNFALGGQIMNWGNVSRREAWALAPNNLLHWRALEAACADPMGPRLYNFGGSTGLPGVETFKASFGATQRVHLRRERIASWARWAVREPARPATVPAETSEE